MTAYTNEMREALQSVEKPVPLTLDVAAGENGILLLVYEDEIMAYPQLDRYIIMEYLETCRNILTQFDVEVGIEGRPGRPRRE